jgi:hypothetical protein
MARPSHPPRLDYDEVGQEHLLKMDLEIPSTATPQIIREV